MIVVDPVSAALSVASAAVSYAQQTKVAAAAAAQEAALGLGFGAVLVVQLASTAFLASRISEIKAQLSSVNATLEHIGQKVDQIQRVQIGQAAVPIRQAINIIDELSAIGPNSRQGQAGSLTAEVARAVALLEQGSQQLRSVVESLKAREVLELSDLVLPILATLELATAYEVALKAALDRPPELLQVVVRRHAQFLAALAAGMAAMPPLHRSPPAKSLLDLAIRMGHSNPAKLRDHSVLVLQKAEDMWSKKADEFALLLAAQEPTEALPEAV